MAVLAKNLLREKEDAAAGGDSNARDLRQLDRDLHGAVRSADHLDALTGKGRGIAVVERVQHSAAELRAVRQIGHVRFAE